MKGGEITMTTFDKVKAIVVEQLGVDESEVTIDSTFIDDLGADSLDIVELVMAFEEEFNVEIPDDVAEKIKTVKKMVGNRNIDIEVDGSIDNETAVYCCKAGANVLVSGGYMFNGDITKNIVILRQSLKILYQG